jgi:hypothetical protein
VNKSDLIKVISEKLGDEGFKRIKNMWYLESERMLRNSGARKVTLGKTIFYIA